MRFQSLTGVPGHLAIFAAIFTHEHRGKFQSLTGVPGHLARQEARGQQQGQSFQSLTGVPGHLAIIGLHNPVLQIGVSIPNGRPRPFSLYAHSTASAGQQIVSIPNGRPRPFSPYHRLPSACHTARVSIPNGRPRPFSRSRNKTKTESISLFQSLTGVPGHLAEKAEYVQGEGYLVSIPNGRPRPFSPSVSSPAMRVSRSVSIPNGRPRPFSPHRLPVEQPRRDEFQSLTGVPGHLANDQ